MTRDAGNRKRPRDFHLAASGSKLIAYELSQPPVFATVHVVGRRGESKNLINLGNTDTVTPPHQLRASQRNSGVFTPKLFEV